MCASILQSFGLDRETTFDLIDSKSRAPQRGSAAAASGGRTRSGDDSTGHGGSAAVEALAAKRRKLNERNASSRAALSGSLPLAILGMLAFCAVTGLVAFISSDGTQGDAVPDADAAASWCSGVDGPAWEIKGVLVSEASSCYGPPLSTCPYSCFRAYDPVGNFTCLPGNSKFTGGACVPSLQRATEAIAVDEFRDSVEVEIWGWCKGGATKGMSHDPVDACFGPPGSSCDYRCLPGYVAQGALTCHEEEPVYSGAHCEPDLQGSASVGDQSNAKAKTADPVVL